MVLVGPPPGTTLATATAWGGSPSLASAFSQVGAFPLAASSADSALLETLPPGAYTSIVSGVNATSGVALAEIYDADPAGSPASLLNLSARANVGTGADTLIAGFVVEGDLPVRVLLRGVGPSLALAPFNLTGVLKQPQILLFNSGGAELGGNMGWGGDPHTGDGVHPGGRVCPSRGLRGCRDHRDAFGRKLHRAAYWTGVRIRHRAG